MKPSQAAQDRPNGPGAGQNTGRSPETRWALRLRQLARTVARVTADVALDVATSIR